MFSGGRLSYNPRPPTPPPPPPPPQKKKKKKKDLDASRLQAIGGLGALQHLTFGFGVLGLGFRVWGLGFRV